jgi:hypothetical protein
MTSEVLPVSDRFLAALRDVHAMSVAAYLIRPGETEQHEVRVTGGSVDMNAAARVLRQGTLDLAYSREDTATAELLADMPYGGYCIIERGLRFADGTMERVRLGTFRVESVVQAELSGVASLTLADRYAQVQDEPFAAPWSPNGLKASDALVALVRQVFGDTIQYRIETTPASEPVISTATIYDQDRTEAISDLASSISAEAIFDAYGDFVVRPNYRADAEPVWTIDAGERGVLVKGEAQIDRSSVRNGVSVRGQPDSELPPVYGLAVYDNPDSPIRWGGPFGRVVMIADSTTVTSQAQAEAVARSLLNLRLSLTRTLNLEAVPNPALEPEDMVQVVFPDGHREEQALKEVHVGLGTDASLGLIAVDKYAADFEPTRLRLLRGEEATRELQLALVGA